MSIEKYRKKRHKAKKLPPLKNHLSPSLSSSVYKEFANTLGKKKIKDNLLIWEPFASPRGNSFHYFWGTGVRIVAQTLGSIHPDILNGDSTVVGPPKLDKLFDGVIFHPPYFGSAAQSDCSLDLSIVRSEDEYRRKIDQAARLSVERLGVGGKVCAVGRRYRFDGKEIKLDEWMIESFEGFKVSDVWISEPDVIIIMERKKRWSLGLEF